MSSEKQYSKEKNAIENPKGVFNFWDKFFAQYEFHNLRNVSTKWYSSDTHEMFLKNSRKQSEKTYTSEEIEYKFNSLGFRSEEFDTETDAPVILYGGCSITAGVGLPVEHIWASMLNEFISRDSGKELKLFNLSYGGRSIDSICRYIYVAVNNGLVVPDMVLLNLPPVWRKELFESRRGSVNNKNYVPGMKDNIFKAWEMVENPHLAIHEAFKSLLLLKYFLDTKGIPLFFTYWDEQPILDESVGKTKKLREIFETELPTALVDCFIGDLSMIHDSIVYTLDPSDIRKTQWVKKYECEIARDYMHYGPNSHYELASNFYAKLSTCTAYTKMIKKYSNYV